MKKFTIAICGAGPVGQMLALLLVKYGISPSQIVLIDAKTAEQANNDKRTIALSYGSRQLLQTVSVWPINATEIHQIHVSRRGHFGRTLIDRSEQQVEALGYVTYYRDIIRPLTSALEPYAPALTWLRPATVSAFTQSETHVDIQLADQRSVQAEIQADILVQAEGGLFDQQKAQTRYHDYQQTAIVADVTVSAPIANRAFERFTEQGPLALLPHEDKYALVWCTRPEHSSYLQTLSDQAFLSELQMTFGARLGCFISSTTRYSFALGLNAATTASEGRCIRIGNAAQTLHPVAGQGLNLGLRDAFQLAQFLRKSVEPASLQDFYRARQTDRKLTIQLTDQLAQIFSDKWSSNVKQSMLATAMGALDLCMPAQHWLAKQMMFGHR